MILSKIHSNVSLTFYSLSHTEVYVKILKFKCFLQIIFHIADVLRVWYGHHQVSGLIIVFEGKKCINLAVNLS
jgi:hypothetical protein